MHQGVTKTRLRVAELFWWPKWSTDVEVFVQQCRTCAYSDRTKKAKEVPLRPVALPRRPWDKIAVDLKGPIQGSRYKYLLVIVDYYSKWPEVYGVNTISSKTVIDKLRSLFSRYGLPKEIVSDNGTQFVSAEVKHFFERLDISHRRVALYAPHQNGLVERFNKVLGEKIEESKKMRWNLDQTIESALFHYRSTPHVTTKISRFEAFFGRKMRSTLTNLRPDAKIKVSRICRKDVKLQQSKMKVHADRKRVAKDHTFKAGDWVQIKGANGKFGHPLKVVGTTSSSVFTNNNKKWPANRVVRWRPIVTTMGYLL